MSRGLRSRRRIRDGVAAVLALAVLGLVVRALVREPTERSVRLTMSAGRPEGVRHRIAGILAREAARRGVQITLQPTAGSEEALKEIDAGRLQLALVQGGLDPGGRGHVRQVAALHVEPLHLLVKDELFPAVSKNLAALKGKVINLGERGSGTHSLAWEVLAFAGLRPALDGRPADYDERNLSYAELEQETDPDRLPDAVFMVSTLPSAVARHLVTRHHYRLVALPFAEAFAIDSLDLDLVPGGEGVAARIERQHVYDVEIPAFTYEVEPGVPAQTIHTLGTRLLLVAHKDVDSDAIGRLLDATFFTPFAQVVRPPLDAKLLDLPPELPWHPGTTGYLQRNKPLIAGDAIDLLEKSLSILGAVVTAAFFLGHWIRQRYRDRRDRGFEAYILKVAEVERQAMALERSASIDLAALLALQDDLSRLKGEALEKFADGELEGEELMSGFLAHISDTRDYLTRLILHERDNLEEQAIREGRRPQALWREVVGPPPAPDGADDAPTAASAAPPEPNPGPAPADQALAFSSEGTGPRHSME
jgi:TRAP-type uncharacterized transport system substrate-binding protein